MISWTVILYFVISQVVPDSGPGWERFRVVPAGPQEPAGLLQPVGPLDYEDPIHRKGFRFKVKLTDVVGIQRCDEILYHNRKTA